MNDFDIFVRWCGGIAMAILMTVFIVLIVKAIREENRRDEGYRERDARRHGYPRDGDQ